MEIKKCDFTEKVKTKCTIYLKILILLTNVFKWFATNKSRITIEIYLGGLLLEDLYHRNQASYYVIVAKKQPKRQDE